jgi:hypothetical protein
MWPFKQIPALLILSASLGLNLAAGAIAPAQSSELSEQIIAQETETPSAPRRRIKPSFFEEERRPKFGFGDFLDSALNGVENAFGADDTTQIIQGVGFNAVSVPVLQGISGILTVSDFEDNNIGTFLNTTLTGEGVNLSFTNSQPNSDQRTGTITVNGTVSSGSGTLTFNNEVRQYNAGFSNKGNDVSAVFLIVDPNNPNNSIFIQLPRTAVEGANDLNDDDDVVSGRASLSIGLPSDR